jgi:hypothetical protein
VALPTVLLFVASSICGGPRAQEPERDDPLRIDQTARNRQPAFLVRAEVNHATRDYREGDALSVGVASEVDAYLYVFYQQADGKGTYCVG